MLALVSLALSAASFTQAAERRPNVLVILADDLGYGELTCQGNPQVPTPQIDSIARGGVRFTSGYVSAPLCSPSRAGLMTGRYQQRFGHEFNVFHPNPARQPAPPIYLSLKETTIADRLKAAGYATGIFGKWHLGYSQYHPMKRGFDEFFGFLGSTHDYLDAKHDFRNPILRGFTPVERIDYTTDAFARETAAFIEKHKDRPWFAYLSFNAVHVPLQATEKYLSRFPNIEDKKRHVFAAMTSAMDDAVGAVLAKLRECRLEDDTLIFFLSDNGGGPTAGTTSGNGPLRGSKGQTWEGGIRVPFMVQWKGRIPAGKVYDRPVIQLDILPTALAAAGVDVKPEWKLDGVNLLPYLMGERSDPPHDALYWRIGQQIAIRMGDWKLVKSQSATEFDETRDKATTEGAQLYNLAEDIGERNNLAEREPEKVRQLSTAWSKWDAELAKPAWYYPPWRYMQKSGPKGKPADAPDGKKP